MFDALALLLVCQLLGEAIHRLAGVPLPGAILGLLLLLLWLGLVRKERPKLGAVTGWLTAHITILFVPSTVGLIEEGAVLSRYGIGIAVATIISSLLTMLVTVAVFRWALRFSSLPDERWEEEL
jgi:holin-like protein